jgi:hypothetical protein
VLAAFIIRAMMEAMIIALIMETASTSETSVNLYQRIHGATTQKIALFILAAVRT